MKLRSRAEAKARSRMPQIPEHFDTLSLEKIRETLHELTVYQIELEMQNEELRRTEAKLDAARARYFDLYDLAPVGYCTISEAGLILEANLTAASSLGLPRGALTHQPITRFVCSEDQDALYRLRRRLFASQEPEACELRMVRHDKSIFWARMEATVTPDSGGGLEGRVVISDITERKRAEEALERSRLELAAIYDHALVMICVLNSDRSVAFANPAFTDFIGLPEETLRDGRACVVLNCVQAIDAPQTCDLGTSCENCTLRQALADTFKTGVSHHSFEHRATLLHQGQRREVCLLGSTTQIRVADQSRVLLCLHDITERKALEAQLLQAQKMESIGRLAGGVAHDFNNLLTVINGYSKLMLAMLEDADPMRAHLTEIYNAGERAASLTRQLLAYSRNQILQPRSLDLNRLVEEMREMLHRLMIGEGVELRVALNAEHGTVRADPHQLEQVIMNLAVNSRDAMPGGGRLLIETSNAELDHHEARRIHDSRPGNYVVLSVSDAGAGIDLETQQRIFEPFFTTKEVGKGTGLGLSMVQGIVAQSGGFIRVESEPGQGTTFRIYLPAVADVEVAAAKYISKPRLDGRETILVVEDQDDLRKYAVAVLTARGYRVLQAASASEALAISEEDAPRIHLAIADLVLQGMSGAELKSQLQKRRPGLNVLFLSEFNEAPVSSAVQPSPSANSVMKPFTPDELAEKVRAMLGPPPAAARILIADDEDGVRGFLRAALEQRGYEVVEASDGNQAIDEVRKGQIDLVITDVIMPGQDGTETVRKLRSEMPDIGIIAISGGFKSRSPEAAKIPGADVMLTKPVSAETLLNNVTQLLKLRR